MGAPKYTPAMARWCAALTDGRTKIERTGFTNMRASGGILGGSGGFTYVMGSKLEDAGLIRWQPPTKIIPGTIRAEVPSFENPQRAVLTEAGIAAAAGWKS